MRHNCRVELRSITSLPPPKTPEVSDLATTYNLVSTPSYTNQRAAITVQPITMRDVIGKRRTPNTYGRANTYGLRLRSTIFISSVVGPRYHPEVDLSAPSWVASHGSYFCRRTEDRGARSDNGGAITEEPPDHPPVKSSDTCPAPLLCIAHWLDDAAHALIWCFLTWEQFPSGVKKTHETHGTHSSVYTVFCFNECIIQLQICDISEQQSGQKSFYSFIGNIFMIAFSFYIFIYCHFHSVSH